MSKYTYKYSMGFVSTVLFSRRDFSFNCDFVCGVRISVQSCVVIYPVRKGFSCTITSSLFVHLWILFSEILI